MSNPVQDSNIRWDSWEKVTPRRWRISARSFARFFHDVVDIHMAGRESWVLSINGRFIADFPSWEEASQAAPMLYSLHKEPT
jgi:hypothetical protein